MVNWGYRMRIYHFKVKNMAHLLSLVCKGSLREGSNNCILRVSNGDLLSKNAEYDPYVVLCLLGVTT